MDRVLLIPGDKAILSKMRGFDSELSQLGSKCEFIPLSEQDDFFRKTLGKRYEDLYGNSKELTDASKSLFIFNLSKSTRRSNSFRRRIGREILGKFRPRDKSSFINFARYVISRRTISNFFFLILGFLRFSDKLVYPIFRTRVVRETALLRLLLESYKPNLVVLVSSGFDNIAISLQFLKNQFGFRILYVVNNWDNPTSKMIVSKQIDFVAAWNYEQVKQIEKSNNFPRERICVVGSPAIDETYKRRDNIAISNRNGADLNLLYIGQQNEYDEISDILAISRLIESRRIPYSKLIYRPHPISQEKIKRLPGLLNVSTFLEIDRDSQIEFQKYDAVICLPSTALLEAYLFNKPTIVYIPKDSRFRTDPRTMWKYVHFNEFKKFSTFPVANSFQELSSYLSHEWEPVETCAHQFNSIFPKFNMSFSMRLAKLVESIL